MPYQGNILYYFIHICWVKRDVNISFAWERWIHVHTRTHTHTHTHTHTYIYIYSVLLIELAVPWEENREEAHERKKNRNETLRADCVEKGWICDMIPIEVGYRGFIGHSVILFFSKIGITGRSLKVASNHLQTAAQYASSWIWSKARSFQHEGNTRGTTFPVWLR